MLVGLYYFGDLLLGLLLNGLLVLILIVGWFAYWCIICRWLWVLSLTCWLLRVWVPYSCFGLLCLFGCLVWYFAWFALCGLCFWMLCFVAYRVGCGCLGWFCHYIYLGVLIVDFFIYLLFGVGLLLLRLMVWIL